jgi:hypothetical protein
MALGNYEHKVSMKRASSMMNLVSAIGLLLSFCSIELPAQEAVPSSLQVIKRSTTQSYAEILQRVRETDAGVNYKEFRLAYADSAEYRPSADPQIRRAMFAAVSVKDYGRAAELAEAILKERYVDIYGHQVAALAYRELGDRGKSAVHGSLARELIRSIVESGDGNTPETAMQLISEEEESVILQALDLKPSKQELLDLGGHTLDRVDAADSNDVTITLYFNLDVPVVKARQALAVLPK